MIPDHASPMRQLGAVSCVRTSPKPTNGAISIVRTSPKLTHGAVHSAHSSTTHLPRAPALETMK